MHLWPYAASVFLALFGFGCVIFRRQFARRLIRQNRLLYDNAPTLFPPRADRREERLLRVHEALVTIVGVGLGVGGLFSLWDLLKSWL
jgi:hypothetical protein